MNPKKSLKVIVALMVLLLIIDLAIIIFLPRTTMRFHLDTGQPIDGTVYLNDVVLGTTEEGIMTIEKKNLAQGNIHLTGAVYRRPFNLSFPLTEQKLKKKKIDFTVSENHLFGFTFNFYVVETNKALQGEVYANNESLGRMRRGQLTVNHRTLTPGIIRIDALHEGKNVAFTFNLTREDLKYYAKDFAVTQYEIDTFTDVSQLDTQLIEDEMVRLVNAERTKQGLQPLTKQVAASSIARQRSAERLQKQNERGLGEQLRGKRIFYLLAGENLFLHDELESTTTEQEIAQTAVEGWLASQQQQARILASNRAYSHVAPGVACEQQSCFLSMVFLGTETYTNDTLSSNSCHFLWLYNPDIGYGNDIDVLFRLNANQLLNAHVVTGQREFERCLEGNIIHSLRSYRSTTIIDDAISAKKGYGLVLETNEQTDVEISVQYES